MIKVFGYIIYAIEIITPVCFIYFVYKDIRSFYENHR